jgi:hypothetical protein
LRDAKAHTKAVQRRRDAAITHGDIGFLIKINGGIPFQSLRFPQTRGEVMATAADYRKWAEECFAWARAASDDSVCEQYASLGQVWLEQAARAELLSGMKSGQPAPETPPKVAAPSLD